MITVRPIGTQEYKTAKKKGSDEGFTLIELLVAFSIITTLMAILMPVLARIRRNARNVVTMNDQRQLVMSLNIYTMDNKGRYPESVATIGTEDGSWNWQEPTMVIGYKKRNSYVHRAVSEYLGSYIKDPSVMFCSNTPERYKHTEQSWASGDKWDNPDTLARQDPVIGSYCFYWNYIGFVEEGKVFKGPRLQSGGVGESTLLVSDYLGYGHWRSPKSYGSCERLRNAVITSGTWVSSAYWSCSQPYDNAALKGLGIKLNAGYTDGRVESYKPSETIPMKVSLTADGGVPYPDEMGPGIFLLPQNSLY